MRNATSYNDLNGASHHASITMVVVSSPPFTALFSLFLSFSVRRTLFLMKENNKGLSLQKRFD